MKAIQEHLTLTEKALKVLKSKPVYQKMLKTFLMFHPEFERADEKTQYNMLFAFEINPYA